MAKQKKPTQPKAFDVHRTLPANPRQAAHQHASTHKSPTPLSKLPSSKDIESKKRRFTWKRLVATVLIVAILFGLFITAWDARNASAASAKMFGSGNLLQMLSPTSLKGSDQGRVNVLIVGYSVDDPGHPGASLTDSIMLLSMSTSNHRNQLPDTRRLLRFA
jgi:hypothetical protein